jgi:predicted enzyme related to lactoylglutathione lyase
MEIRLMVIRTNDTQKLADFYTLLGLTFACHRRGSSPAHYAATIGKAALEIYPLAKHQHEADKNLRVGFKVENFDETIKILKEHQVDFSVEPRQTEYGIMAVISDPDGRCVEIYKD